MKLTFSEVKENLAVCRFPNNHLVVSEWLTSPFFSITKTNDELSVVIPENFVRATGIPNLGEVKVDKIWKALKVEGKLDFSLVGIMANISKILADGKVSIFALSTFDTDYILVKEKDFEKTKELLKNSGYSII